MKTNDSLEALLSALAERNKQLTLLSSLLDSHEDAIRKSMERESRRVEKTLRRLDLELATTEMTREEKRKIIKKQDKILAMRKKYDYTRALAYPNIMKKSVVQYAAEKPKKTDEPWLKEAREIMGQVNAIDKAYTDNHANILNAFLNTENGDLKALNDYSAIPYYSDGQFVEEQKTGLMFALATLELDLTPEYLIHLTTLTLPNLTTQKETINHLLNTITDKSVGSLITTYHATKKDNPILAISKLIENLRLYITYPKNKTEEKAKINEAALRVLYYRECMATGIPPAKIDDIFITQNSILKAHPAAPKTTHADSLETMGLFSHKEAPDASQKHTDNAMPIQKK